MTNLTNRQLAMRELGSRMAFHQLMNVALMISHSQEAQIRLSNEIAELQSDPKTTHTSLCEVLADYILNELRHGYQTA